LFVRREKKASRIGAIKTLDYAMTGAGGKENCEKVVDILGLRAIFPLFMKSPKGNKRSGETRLENEGKIKLSFFFKFSTYFFLFRTYYLMHCFINPKLHRSKSRTCVK